ncbi:MAG: hypothetical protein J6K55_06345 [Clostridia bacterium]|nr:hypothetical protein [Clostridia bacterium]
MELFEEILLKHYQNSHSFSEPPVVIINSKSYDALCQIKAIIEDDSLSDPECFMKIEKIICVFEDLGSDGGFRHDFS